MGQVLMQCGHSANAEHDGKPACAICIGIIAGATVEDETPNLEGRLSRCGCGHTEPSSLNLPFFEYLPERPFDRHYCGCRGFD